MDPQLKQRLIGAAVLVVLAIIFVPMVLDGSSTPESQTIDLAIPPAPGRATETRVVPLDPATLPQPAPAPSSLSDAIATVDTAAAPRVDAVDAAAPPASGGTAPDDTAAPAPAASALPAAATVPGAAAAAPPDPAPAQATPAAVPAPVSGGRYAVSFGSYTRRENAQALVESLKKSRIPAYAESVEVNGQAGMRVRAGPYADRTQAEQVRLVARQARPDVPGSIVEIDTTAAAAPTAAAGAAASVTGWSVQVGAYKAQAEANAQRDKLRAGGFAAYVDVLRAEGSTLYRVRVGPEAQRANADKLRDALRARFGLNGNVVTQP